MIGVALVLLSQVIVIDPSPPPGVDPDKVAEAPEQIVCSPETVLVESAGVTLILTALLVEELVQTDDLTMRRYQAGWFPDGV